MSNIVERLLDYSEEDHERGCAGRCYDCSCGYDEQRDPLLTEAADEITRLRADVKQQIRERDHAREISIRYEADNTTLRARVAELEEALQRIVDLPYNGHGYSLVIARAALATPSPTPSRRDER